MNKLKLHTNTQIIWLVSLTISLLGSIELAAQQVTDNNQYLVNNYAINPAFAGYNYNTETFMSYRQNWVGIQGAPSTQIINSSIPLTDNMGIGVNIQNNQIGNFTHFYFDASYAYHLRLGTNLGVSFGVSAKFYRNQINLDRVQTEGFDIIFENKESLGGYTFDAAPGLMVNFQNLYVGFTAPSLVGMKVDYQTELGDAYTLTRHYIGHISYIQRLNDIEIIPYGVVRMTETTPLFYEGALMARFKERLWVAGSYRKSTIGMSFGAALNDKIVLNYTYEMGIGDNIASMSSGSHELTMGFLMKHPEEKTKYATVFPQQIILKNDDAKDDSLRLAVANLEENFKRAISTKNKQIKELDERLKVLEGNIQQLDADMWDEPFVLKNIKFGNNSDRLFSSSFPELNKLVAKLKKNPDMQIKITGYTDNVGSPTYNQRLSKKRAEAVAKYLVSKGIESKNIIAEGKGSANPRADNATAAGRAENRRIEGQFKK